MDVIIVPDKGLAGEIGRQLLALADDPYQVMWVSWPQAGFKVDQELAARFEAGQRLDQIVEGAAASEPRRRGRPRKHVEEPVVSETVPGTDNTNSEEE